MQIEQLASMPVELPPATTTTIADAAAASPKGLSFRELLRTKWRSRGAFIVYAALGLTLLGCKMFWPSGPSDVAASPARAAKPAAVAAKPSPKQPAAKAAGAAAATPAEAAPTSTVAKTTAASAAAPGAAAKKPSAPTTAPVAAARAKADPLGALYIDETNGFSIRFPAGWVMRTFDGEPWVIDVGDGRVGLISVGFAPFPEALTTENIPPDWVAKKIRKRHDTTLHGQGYAMIGGRKALWSKSTGPLPMTHAAPRMTRVNYVLPIGDGRVLELRVAAAPEQFDRLVPVMRKSVGTFKLHTPVTPQTVATARR